MASVEPGTVHDSACHQWPPLHLHQQWDDHRAYSPHAWVRGYEPDWSQGDLPARACCRHLLLILAKRWLY